MKLITQHYIDDEIPYPAGNLLAGVERLSDPDRPSWIYRTLVAPTGWRSVDEEIADAVKEIGKGMTIARRPSNRGTITYRFDPASPGWAPVSVPAISLGVEAALSVSAAASSPAQPQGPNP